jgi:hypothetical protein
LEKSPQRSRIARSSPGRRTRCGCSKGEAGITTDKIHVGGRPQAGFGRATIVGRHFDTEEEAMALKRIAVIFGIVFIAVGLLGWVPALNPGGKLLGLFDVNPAHNLVHLATGIVSLIAGISSDKASKLFFQIFGVIYALVAVLGFVTGDGMLLGIVSNNGADSVLHVIVAVVALYLGFGMKMEAAPAS